ncbi:MAG TPA: hypothetical protein VL380_02940 [Nitrosospira sp.]|nr:hypothetical protein [Nitrosospira sp.]
MKISLDSEDYIVKRYYKCPDTSCGSINEIKLSRDKEFGEKLSGNLFKASLVTMAAALTGGLGGIVLGTYFYGENVLKYVNGKKITCVKCHKDFYI